MILEIGIAPENSNGPTGKNVSNRLNCFFQDKTPVNKCQAWKSIVLSMATTSMDEITSVPLGLKACPVCAARPGLHWASCPGACVTCYHPVLAFTTA